MTPSRSSPPFWLQSLLSALALIGMLMTTPWPWLQGTLQAALLFALSLRNDSPLPGAGWALAAGWCLDLNHQSLPNPGATALANLTASLLAHLLMRYQTVDHLATWWLRLSLLCLAHTLLLWPMLRLANGPFVFQWVWLIPLLLVPVWGSLCWPLHRAHSRK